MKLNKIKPGLTLSERNRLNLALLIMKMSEEDIRSAGGMSRREAYLTIVRLTNKGGL